MILLSIVYVNVNIQDMVFRIPRRTITSEEAENSCLKYYDSDVHRTSFVLPRFAKKVVEHHCISTINFWCDIVVFGCILHVGTGGMKMSEHLILATQHFLWWLFISTFILTKVLILV